MSESDAPSASIDEVLGQFHDMENRLEAFCPRTKSLIEAILQDARIPYQSIQFRVKSADKLKKKFLNPDKNYKQLQEITDLAGLRIITYYEDDIDRVAEIIKGEFDIDLKNSVDKRESEPDRFGYFALNYVCQHAAKRTADVEYKKFAGISCEIQVTSILRHAWSEIEHDWYDLKDSYPKTVKRRFYRLAALLEIAESEFKDIRKLKADFERSVALQVEAEVPDIALTAVSLRSFIETDPAVAPLDKVVAEMLRVEVAPEVSDKLLEFRALALNTVGLKTLEDLRNAVARYGEALPEFVERRREENLVHLPKILQASPPGISLYQMALFIASMNGIDELTDFVKKMKLNPKVDLSAFVPIANEIAEKYSL